MVAEVCLGKLVRFAPARSRASLATVGIGSNSSRCAAWPIPVLVDQETIYAPRHGNDRLLVGLKGQPQRVRTGSVAPALALGTL